jgi:hypothetical protein
MRKLAASRGVRTAFAVAFVFMVVGCSSQERTEAKEAKVKARQAKLQAREAKVHSQDELMQAKAAYADCMQANSAKPATCDGYKGAYQVNLETYEALSAKRD